MMEEDVEEHELDRLRTHLRLHTTALKSAAAAEGSAAVAVQQASQLGERVAVQEHRSGVLDARLDTIEHKVDTLHLQLGKLLERTPFDRFLTRCALAAGTLVSGTVGIWALLQLLDRLKDPP
jgi:hypothetical protein